MKKLIFIVLSGFFVLNCFAQNTNSTDKYSKYLIRSTVGINGISKIISANKGNYFIQQSIGQASVIGTYSNNNITVRQGFLQPLNSPKVQSINITENYLDVNLYPNPFNHSVNILFTEYPTNKVFVVIYNISGGTVYSKEYPVTQEINIPLNYLPKGIYVMKITTDNKQLVSKLIKH